MTNPFSSPPDQTPATVLAVSLALALYILPALFICVCILMRFSRVPRPPYFAYFCAFGALGALSISVATANSPLSALGFYIAFLISPFLLIRNYIVLLRSLSDQTLYHRAARWTSLFAGAIILGFLLWSLHDEYLKSPNQAVELTPSARHASCCLADSAAPVMPRSGGSSPWGR